MPPITFRRNRPAASACYAAFVAGLLVCPSACSTSPNLATAAKPDLVAEMRPFHEVGQTISINDSGEVRLRVLASVINQGTADLPDKADSAEKQQFKLTAEFVTATSTVQLRLASCCVSGPDPITTPKFADFVPLPPLTLPPGFSINSFDVVVFPPSVRGVAGKVFLIADSCIGDELMPSFCRIDELDETNNRSVPFNFLVP